MQVILYQFSFSLALPKNADTTATSIGYNTLMQELARMSSYFCEKAGTGGLIQVHLVTVQWFSSFVATGVSIHHKIYMQFMTGLNGK